jgi:glycosyltransferase involved in cell wall biosynthesis
VAIPRVSVCIPTYQQPEAFRRALLSVLEQNFTNFELVVTDDSSGDEIASVVNEMSDSRIVYLKNPRRRGSPGNWNVAAARAQGELLKFLHHDDWFSSVDSLGGFVGLLDESPSVSFAFSAANVCAADQSLKGVHAPSMHISRLRDDPRYLLLGNQVGAPSATIYRRNGSLQFDETLMWVVDIDFYLNVLTRNSGLAYCDEPLVSVTDGASHQVTRQVETNPRLEVFEWFYLYGKWAPRLPLRGERARFIDSLLARLTGFAWSDYRALGLRGRAARLFVSACLLRELRILSAL